MSLSSLNPSADLIGKNQALLVNIAAAKSLQNVLASNLGPLGTVKMLVSGGGQISLTKDGKVLLNQMQIQHPTAALIARTATAQDDTVGDGTTSSVLFTGELLKQAERYIADGLHPRLLVEGMELARDEALEFLSSFAVSTGESSVPRETLVQAARTSLRTKLQEELADHLTEIVVDAVLCINREDSSLDLHMVEIMEMQQRSEFDTMLVKGIVLDHGARHPNMARHTENAHILIANVSLEFEKTEVNSGFFYSSAEERQKMVSAERRFTDDRVRQIIALKEKVCTDRSQGFVLINQKGIDPISLDMLQKAGIVGIRRAKRRNMERLALACGGYAVNSLDDLDAECLGFASSVTEHAIGEDRFTFVESGETAHSCTILIRGPNKHSLTQMKDAIRDGLRAVKNVLCDRSVVDGAGAFELAAHKHLHEFQRSLRGRRQLGVQAFADALLVIPKTLAQNAGLDVQQTLLDVMDEARKGARVGVDLVSGKPILPAQAGIWDNACVKRQLLQLGSIIATKLLLVDEIMRAGRASSKQAPGPGGEGMPME